MKDAIKVATDTIRKDMIFRFLQSKVGLKEVEQIAEQMIKQQKCSEGTRDDKFEIVKDLMKHKKKDAIKCVNKSKQSLNKNNAILSKTVRKGTIVREAFMEVVDMELNHEWRTGKERMNDKKKWAIHKYKTETKGEEIEMLDGVLVGDKLLEELETKNKALDDEIKASVYCDIKITEEQEKVLLLPPEHQTYPKLNLEEFETDLAKCAIKERWETIRESRKCEESNKLKEMADMEPDKVVKNTSDKVYYVETKVMDIRNLKAKG